MSKEAMKLALEALEDVTRELLAIRDELAERGGRPKTNVFHQRLWDSSHTAYTDKAIPAAAALREALAEQPAQQEPVAWIEGEEIYWHNAPDLNDWIRQNGQPLYTAPPPCPTCEALARTVMLDQTSHDTSPPAQRKPLTLGQKQKLWSSVGHKPTLKDRVNAYGLAIEAAHGIK